MSIDLNSWALSSTHPRSYIRLGERLLNSTVYSSQQVGTTPWMEQHDWIEKLNLQVRGAGSPQVQLVVARLFACEVWQLTRAPSHVIRRITTHKHTLTSL